ncbi:NAD-binding protein [Crepidotus variabilis]|uniref:NAD-binding protein n=1 Tax=Crepidotus variabilis TaxID=179855 RepID=A0A9P6E882_9AGAR|nr:NAD-binding protein [Crepidotus variabilis]
MSISALYSQSFPPKSKFTVDDIPDLTGRIVIVTGANVGVGKETAKALLSHNAKVYLAARNKEKAEAAINELKELTGREGIFLKLDLSNLASVKAAAEEFLSKENELHILFNNAGVMVPPHEQLTTQGYDLQFGTNVLGHFYFTTLLLPALIAGKNTSPDKKSRVVTTSSGAAYLSSGINFDALVDGHQRKKTSVETLYKDSKLGNLLFANELAKRYEHQGIISTSVNPGNLKSDLQRHVSFIQSILIKPLLHPVAFGALTQLWAGTSPEGLELNGQFLIPWARRTTDLPSAASNAKLAADLWTWCEEQVAKHP